MSKIRILIVEDHEVVRKGLAVLLEAEQDLEVVGEASDGEEAIAKAHALQPDVVLMDLKLTGLGGVEASRKIKTASPHAKVLVLTGLEDDEHFFQALRGGVNGYLLKAIAPSELVRAIRAVARGEVFFHPAAARKVLERFSGSEKQQHLLVQLTAREQEVLRLMATSATYRQIADKLGVTEETVRKHAKSILHKLNQPDRTQAVLAALRAGLIKLE
jgi:NarL family two-component system response regulator LiaR